MINADRGSSIVEADKKATPKGKCTWRFGLKSSAEGGTVQEDAGTEQQWRREKKSHSFNSILYSYRPTALLYTNPGGLMTSNSLHLEHCWQM